ncbi:hypothetical protein B9Z55_006414 [Caenorhabditis nigoni]|uniref:Uncharacterized protein n=1 Tax=Caenorhabditis nigoni TaxID=1611254 RepID=A0A2G5V5G0_9PELO|nr:hypothetical protein B9Z55_006414 [Caenorhabditis nigoni]
MKKDKINENESNGTHRLSSTSARRPPAIPTMKKDKINENRRLTATEVKSQRSTSSSPRTESAAPAPIY